MMLGKVAGGAAFGSSLYPYWVGYGYCRGWPDPAAMINNPVNKLTPILLTIALIIMIIVVGGCS
jgi:hypothetical protein